MKVTDTNDDFYEILALQRQIERDFPKRIYAKLEISGEIYRFQLDSGASVNVLPETIYRGLPGQQHLRPATSSLFMYDKSELETCGGIIETEVGNPKTNRTYMLEFYVVLRHKQPILGAAACQLMNLLTVRTENILVNDTKFHEPGNITREYLIRTYEDIFKGYGKLDGTVHLETDSDVQPVRLPLRKLPIAVKEKVRIELERMMRPA